MAEPTGERIPQLGDPDARLVSDLVEDALARTAELAFEPSEIRIERLSKGLYQVVLRLHGRGPEAARYLWNESETVELEGLPPYGGTQSQEEGR